MARQMVASSFLVLILATTVASTSDVVYHQYHVQPGTGCNTSTTLTDGSMFECSDIATLLMSITVNTSVEIIFSPGEYSLEEANVIVDYSLNLSSWAAVINCRSGPPPANNSQITFSNVSFVSLSGLTFSGCYSLRMDEVEYVTIDDCTFRDFLSPSVDIKDSIDIKISNSFFLNNSVSTVNDRYRADAAGLSLSYYFSSPPETLQVFATVKNCTFKNNKGKVPYQLLSQQISQVLNQQFYPARGGALGIIITEKFVNISGVFEDIIFDGNYAEAFGGGVYIGLDGIEVTHSLIFRSCTFVHNVCDGGAGGLIIAYLKNRHEETESVTLLEDCVFINNTAHTGGGILSLQTRLNGSHDYLIVRSSNFSQNKGEQGAAIAFASLFNIQSQDVIIPSIIEDCYFADHDSQGGTVIAGFTHIAMQGVTTFSMNKGPTLRVIGCLLLVKGSLSFINNDVTITGGAAMHFTAFAQMRLFKTADIFFINNTGILGAAIRVDLQSFPPVFTQLLFNPLCFILYEEPNTAPINWKSNLIHFYGNRAQLGSVMYMSYFDLCSYYKSDTNSFNDVFSIDQFPTWPVFEFGENTNIYHKDSTNSTYYVQTPALTIDKNSFENNTIQLRPGEEKTFRITGLDQFNNPTYFVARVIDENESLRATLSSLFTITDTFDPPADYNELYMDKNEVSAIFSPSLLPVYPNGSSDVSFSLRVPSSSIQQLNDYTRSTSNKRVLIQIDNPNGITYNYLNVSFHVLPCYPGYDLQQTNGQEYTCVCTGASDDSFAVLDCDDDHDAILLRNGYWVGFDREGADEGGSPNLDVYTCPITYCQCRYETDSCITEYIYLHPNNQCHPPRKGTLCGQCSDNTTVTILRLQCNENCQGNYHIYYGTAILIIVDVLVIVVVLLASVKLSITFPHSLRAVVFYIQTVYITTEYFPVSFWNSRQYMLYLSNLLGLYFPVDFCFVSNAPTVLALLPRFIPPLLVFIVPLFFLRWKRGSRKIYRGLWSLILVTYAPLCYTCMTLLHCPILADVNGEDDVMRWYLDGSIQCFRDVAHIIPGVLAIIILLGLILLIPLVVLLVVFKNHPFFQERYPILLSAIDALKAGYRSHCTWWGGIELFKRLLLVGLAVGLPGRTVAPVYFLTFLLFLHIYVRPYKYIVQNIIEAVVLFDYCLLFLLRSPQTLLESLSSYSGTSIQNTFGSNLPSNDGITYFFWPFFYFPVFMGIAVGIAWIMYRICKAKKKREIELMEQQNRARTNVPISIGVDHYIDHDTIVSGKITSDLGDYYLVDETPISKDVANKSATIQKPRAESKASKKD